MFENEILMIDNAIRNGNAFLLVMCVAVAAYFLPVGRLTLRQVMSKAWIVGAVLLALALLTSCAPDPRNQADAERTRIQAEQAAADQAQARAQQQAEWDLKQTAREQVLAEWVASTKEFIAWWMKAALVSSILVTLGLGVGTTIGVIGLGRGVAKAAEFRATWVPLDVKTGNYPAIQYAGHGHFFVADLNTGQVLQLDTAVAADRQMVASAMKLRLAGVVTRNLADTRNPNIEGVATAAMDGGGIVKALDVVSSDYFVDKYDQENSHAD